MDFSIEAGELLFPFWLSFAFNLLWIVYDNVSRKLLGLGFVWSSDDIDFYPVF